MPTLQMKKKLLMPASDSDAFPDLYLRPSDELTFASLALLHHAMHHRPAVVAEGGRGVCRVLPLVVKMVRLLRSTNQSRGCFGKLPPIAIPGFILFNAFIRFNHTHKKREKIDVIFCYSNTRPVGISAINMIVFSK